MKLNNDVMIQNFSRPYFIAELNTSHFGSIEIAKEMIDAAKLAGCDCVKFQSWSASTLYSNTYYKKNPVAKRFVDKFSMSFDDLKLLANYAGSKGISFSSTPYSIDEVDFLINECDVPFIKVASMEINNIPYLQYIARSGSAIVLSTGMADQHEISKAVETILDEGNKNLCLLHCVSIYPAEISTINLNNIQTLQRLYDGVPIGYSDHTLGFEASIAAVALGAPVIEKHFTLDSSRIGMDNQMAMEPSDFRALVVSCNRSWESLGAHNRIVSELELAQRINMRRSIVSKRLIPAGKRIDIEDLDFKRPGDGFGPSQIDLVVGSIARQDIPSDEVIYSEMLN